MQANIKKTRDAAVNSIARAFSVGLIDEAARQAALDALEDSRAVARRRLAAFVAATGAKLVPAKLCSIEALVKSYFDMAAPFEPTGDKKAEFPDALALLSLEEWARSSGKTILAASSDKGWKAFADTSEHVFVEGGLADALQIVQQHAEEADTAIQAFLRALDSGQLDEVEMSINALLSNALTEWEFDVEASSSLRFEVDQSELKFESFQLLEQDGVYGVTMVRIAAEETVFRLEMEITATAHADFSLYMWDSIDREEFSMGGTSTLSEETFDAAVLITISGPINGPPNELEVTEIEVIEALGTVDMGEIELDYGEDDDDYNQFHLMLEAEAEVAPTSI